MSTQRAILQSSLVACAPQSAEAFGTAALLRNKLTHHYPDQSKLQLNSRQRHQQAENSPERVHGSLEYDQLHSFEPASNSGEGRL